MTRLCAVDDIYVPRRNGVPVACYDSSTHAETDTCIIGLHMHVPVWMCHLGSKTSHVDPGSWTFEC